MNPADNLRSLVDKALPDLDEAAKEKLSMIAFSDYLGSLTLPSQFINAI